MFNGQIAFPRNASDLNIYTLNYAYSSGWIGVLPLVLSTFWDVFDHKTNWLRFDKLLFPAAQVE